MSYCQHVCHSVKWSDFKIILGDTDVNKVLVENIRKCKNNNVYSSLLISPTVISASQKKKKLDYPKCAFTMKLYKHFWLIFCAKRRKKSVL